MSLFIAIKTSMFVDVEDNSRQRRLINDKDKDRVRKVQQDKLSSTLISENSEQRDSEKKSPNAKLVEKESKKDKDSNSQSQGKYNPWA